MKRLTKRIGNEIYVECGDKVDITEKGIIDLLKNKLAAYEDAEEQGRLVVLPCAVGDTVWTNLVWSGWYFRKSDKPYSAKIIFVGINDSKEMGGGFMNVLYDEKGHMNSFQFSDIGKTVFLTREEAEKALGGMKNG